MKLGSIFLLATLALTSACRNVDRFDTKGNAAYCGDIVYAPSFTDGFLVDNQPPQLRLKLTLDTSQLTTFSDDTTALPGTLTTNDASTGLCSETGQALFQAAPLRTIPQVYHDALSGLTFGEGHDEDFFAWVDSTCLGTMLALVSLLRGGEVEVRLFKPAALPPPDSEAAKRPGFALFSLKRNDQGCEF